MINAQPAKGANLGVTQFKLEYFDAQGNALAFPITGLNLQKIQTIQISMILENVTASELVETAPINQQFSSAFWQQMRLSSRNYRNR